MEERNSKKLKDSPSISKKIIFFEGNFNTHNNRLGTAQHALVGCSDLAGQSSNLTAGMAAGKENESTSSSEGIETWTSEPVRDDQCYE